MVLFYGLFILWFQINHSGRKHVTHIHTLTDTLYVCQHASHVSKILLSWLSHTSTKHDSFIFSCWPFNTTHSLISSGRIHTHTHLCSQPLLYLLSSHLVLQHPIPHTNTHLHIQTIPCTQNVITAEWGPHLKRRFVTAKAATLVLYVFHLFSPLLCLSVCVRVTVCLCVRWAQLYYWHLGELLTWTSSSHLLPR